MRNKTTLILILAVLTASHFRISNAQTEESFTPSGKPFALIFTNLNSTFNKDGNSKGIELTRAYFGYEYFFSKNISSKVTLDVGDPGVGKLQMTAFVKNAYVMYRSNNFSARFGMIGVDQFNVQEKQWGYRYIYKSFQDEYSYSASADLGAAFEYSPAKFISLDFSVLNGEGYKKVQSDSTLKMTFGATFMPVKGLLLRVYVDMMKNDYNQKSLALYAGYSVNKLKTGLEYNIQKNNEMLDGRDFSGISAYASYSVAEKYSVFARYDKLQSITLPGRTFPWNYGKDGQLYMAGFDYSPTPGVKIAPTLSGWSPDENTRSFTTKIALNFELKF